MEKQFNQLHIESEACETEFTWKGGAKQSVKLGASWNNWLPVSLMNKEDTWSLVTKVPHGTHSFQFLVDDGEWRHSSLFPILTELEVRNNVRVSAKPPGATDVNEVSTEFVWIDGGRDVKLCAEWREWIPLEMKLIGDGLWSVCTPVPIGTFKFRYLVDGQPRHSKRVPVNGEPSKVNFIQVGKLSDDDALQHPEPNQSRSNKDQNAPGEQAKIKNKCCTIC